MGAGGLGKSCLAGKLAERFKPHTLIVVHGKLNAMSMEKALEKAFFAAKDQEGKELLAAKLEMEAKLKEMCYGPFQNRKYLILLDDFEQNLEGAEGGSPGNLSTEAVPLLAVLLEHLPFCLKNTHLLITCRYGFSFTLEAVDKVKQKLEWVYLHGFKEPEQLKKARELAHISRCPDKEIRRALLDAGHGNPRLMEWLDKLAGEKRGAELAELIAAFADKQREFIELHVIKELLACGGTELADFLSWLAIYRDWVQIDGVRRMAEKAGLDEKMWKRLLDRGMALSLTEHDRALGLYRVTPLLREELSAKIEDCRPCHEAAFQYYRSICEGMTKKDFDAVAVEEWVYFALACGEEETASRWGGRLVNYLRDRLAFRESKRVGLWVLEKKQAALTTADDAFLLNSLGYTLRRMGEHEAGFAYYEQSLAIAKTVFGPEHEEVAIRLNNLGSAWVELGDKVKAIGYYEEALSIDEKVYGREHPNVAIRLNNLGEAWRGLGESRKAIGYFEEALSIDEKVYGREHPDVAIDLNNLGSAYYQSGDKQKAIALLEEAYAIKLKFFGPEHPSSKLTAEWLEGVKGG